MTKRHLPTLCRPEYRWPAKIVFRNSHFKYESDPTPDGTHVRVTHMPSGKTRAVVVLPGASIGSIRARLKREIESELCSSGDFLARISQRNNQTLVIVTHKPSGKSRQSEVPAEEAFETKIQLIDEILVELAQQQSASAEDR